MNKTMYLRDFVKYSSLNVLGMTGLSCYILADTFFISKGLGANGLTALNLAIPIYSFIHGSGLMIGMGGGTKYMVFRSQNNKKAASQVFTTAALLTAVLASIFFFAGLFFSGFIARLLGADGTVYAMTKIYLQVILLFAPMFMMNNLLLCFVRNDGAPQFSMAAMLGGSLSNIILDYIFIFPLNMGIFGAVLATGAAPVISMLMLLPLFLRKKNGFHLCRCRILGKQILNIFSCGLPSLITEVSSGIVIIVFNILILNLEGNTGVAAYGVIANLSLVVLSVYTGIAQGIQPIISSSYGVGNHVGVKTILRYALITVAVLSGMMYSVIFFGADQIAGIFNSEHNELLQSIAVTGLRYYFTASVFAGFNIILCVYFTSTEYAVPAHVISLLRGFVIVIPMAFLLSAVGGMTGVWCVFPVTEFLVSMAGLALFLRRNRTVKNTKPCAL